MYSKPHYLFNPTDGKSAELAQKLSGEWAGASQADCDVVIDVGGDGTIYYSMTQLPGKPNFAIKAEASKSKLCYGHQGLTSGNQLRDAVNAAVLFEFNPLKADVKLSDGKTVKLTANSDIIIERFVSQGLLLNLSSNFNPASQRLGGDSLIFATAMGSTGSSFSSGGKIMPLEHGGIVVTGGNVFELLHDDVGAPYLEYDGKNVSAHFLGISGFEVQLISPSLKRPVKVCFDSGTLLPDGTIYKGFPLVVSDERYITEVSVGMDTSRTNRLLKNREFATPAHLNVTL